MAIGLITYQDASRRESLLSILKDVSPLGGNYLVENLGTSVARNTLHEWPTYYQSRPTTVSAVVEGADATVVDLTAPVRSNNITAIISDVVKVSGTERAVAVATNQDPYAFQKEKSLMRMNAKMEFALLNGTSSAKASGASGVARGMAGIDGVISTNVTALSSGTSLSVDIFENILQLSWNQVGNEYVADTIICPMGLKRKISSFTTNVTNYVNETDKLYRNISVYEASTGVVKIVPHKDVRNVSGSVTLYALRLDTFKMAFLENREPQFVELAKTGDYEFGQYITEMTLESYAEPASVKVTGFAITG
jgi:hypothetical protein